MRYIHGALPRIAMRPRSNGSPRGSIMPLQTGGDLPWASLLLAILRALWCNAQCAIIIPRATCASAPLRGIVSGPAGAVLKLLCQVCSSPRSSCPFLVWICLLDVWWRLLLARTRPRCFLSASSESCLPPRPSFSPSPFPPFFSGSLSVCSWACSVRPCEGRIKRGSPAFYFSPGPVTGARPVPPSGEKVPSHCPSPT